MESQPQNPEFRISPENFHPCNFNEAESMIYLPKISYIHQGHNADLNITFKGR